MPRPYINDVAPSPEHGGSESVDALSADTPQSEDIYVFPASLEQSRYWILDQLEGASTASNMAIAFRLEGEVQDALVKHCIQEITLRHEALRTTFRMIDGSLCQVISEDPVFSFTVTDLKELPEADRLPRAETLIHEHSRVQVNLASGPSLFVHLIHVSDQSHFLAFTLHHIACDGWSNGILIQDFAELYSAAAEGRPATLPELPFQFADFTVWQQSWLESKAAESALAFWKEHIQRDMPAVDLPTDFPRKAGKSFPGNIESQLMSPDLQARLKAYCRKHDATLHQVLLAAFEALIARYANQNEFLLGSTIANRTQPGMENVVGRFAHPQVILADVRGNPSYRELLRRVIDWSAASYAHQDLPFSRLTEAFQLDQAGATSQFLQVYFVYQKAFMQPQAAGDLKIIPRPSVSGGVNFDLLVSIVERSEGPRLQVEFNTELFKQTRIRRLIELYLRVLDAVMQDDTLRISALPLHSEGDQAVSAAAHESQTYEAIDDASLPELFDRHVEARGHATAIESSDGTISWKDLKARTLQSAEALHALGLRAGQTVALRMEANAGAAAAAFAIMRLGAVVLPIPSAASSGEWRRVIAELQPSISIASQSFAEGVPSIVSFEQLKKSERNAPHEMTYPPLTDAAWASATCNAEGKYEIQTASHLAALQGLTRAARALDIMPGDAVLVLPSWSSADAWTDLMLPLLAGAVVVYYSEQEQLPLQAALDRYQVSHVFGSPEDWTKALSRGWQGDRRLNVVSRGSRLSLATASLLAQTRGKTWSLVSSVATAGPLGVAQLSPATASQWPIGPLPNEELRVIDEWGNPTASGIPGELAVRRNAHDIRTGFHARYSLETGHEMVERPYGSVRLHGYRLSLGELEDLLVQHPSVAAAAAAIQASADGHLVLTAYLTARDEQGISIPAVSAWLKTSGPGHLAAAELVSLPVIPRRIDGTVDLASLPALSDTQAVAADTSEYVPPRDKLETDLVEIWEEVLGVHGIGIRTSFFTLGGYSLMMVRLFARINRALSVALPITTIFNAPTIEKLADIIRGRTLYSPLVPVKTTGTKPPFFLIHSYLLYGSLPSALGKDYPFYGLRELNGRDQHQTIEARVASYADEIRTVQPHGPYYIGGWCAAGPLAVETARKFVEDGEEVATVVLFDSWRPGYAAELATKQSGTPDMALKAVLGRKWRFHMIKLGVLTTSGKMKYLWDSGVHKVVSMRDRAYLKHWAFAQRLFSKFGLPLPHFMHNISLRTLNQVREYKAQSFPVPITLIRATDAIYIPGANPTCGWDALTSKGVEVLWAPGDHESMFVEPNLSKVGDILRNCVDKARAVASEDRKVIVKEAD